MRTYKLLTIFEYKTNCNEYKTNCNEFCKYCTLIALKDLLIFCLFYNIDSVYKSIKFHHKK